MIIPHYWNPQQVERFLDSLAALGLRRARVAALISRNGLLAGQHLKPDMGSDLRLPARVAQELSDTPPERRPVPGNVRGPRQTAFMALRDVSRRTSVHMRFWYAYERRLRFIFRVTSVL